MKLRGILLTIILVLAPFLRSPVFHACPMVPDATAAACCCGGEAGAPSDCCTVIPLPLGERMTASPATLTLPEGASLLAWAAAPLGAHAGPDLTFRPTDPTRLRPPRPPHVQLRAILLI